MPLVSERNLSSLKALSGLENNSICIGSSSSRDTHRTKHILWMMHPVLAGLNCSILLGKEQLNWRFWCPVKQCLNKIWCFPAFIPYMFSKVPTNRLGRSPIGGEHPGIRCLWCRKEIWVAWRLWAAWKIIPFVLAAHPRGILIGQSISFGWCVQFLLGLNNVLSK